MHRSLLFLLACGLATGGRAQSINRQLLRPGLRLTFGLQGGTGREFASDGAVAPPPHAFSYITGGVTAGYLLSQTSVPLTVQVSTLFTNRAHRPWQSESVRNGSLFIPIMLRTGLPKQRLHLLLGAGPTFWITGGEVPGNYRGLYATHPAELTGVGGVEVRVAPLSRIETTVSLTYRHSFSRSLTYYRPEQVGAPVAQDEFYSWVGATLNLYLHQPSRPR